MWLGRTYRWHLSRDLDLLLDRQNALLDGALEVGLLRLLAQVHARGEEADQAVLDDDLDVGAFDDRLVDSAGGFDGEGSSTTARTRSVTL